MHMYLHIYIDSYVTTNLHPILFYFTWWKLDFEEG
jgi:hypothetical protein